MSIMNRCLNFEANNDILSRLGINDNTNLLIYNKCYNEYINNPEQINNFIRDNLISYINKNYSLINLIDVDINYYIDHINLFVGKKFKNVISEINIEHIISLCDYFKKKNLLNSQNQNQNQNQISNNYIYWRNIYNNIIYETILCGEYKPFKSINKINLIELLDNLWNNLNFTKLIEFTNSLNKIKFLGQNVDQYINIITNKFDNIDNIIKLIDYINKRFNEDQNEDNQLCYDDNSDIENNEMKNNTSKYNFRFVIDCLKSNGYLLFEEYNKIIKKKYKKIQLIQTIKIDKRIINYFMYLISQKDSNSVNRKVNEILIRLKNYLQDIEESYYNNIGYQKINVKQESDKYKSIDISSYNRTNSTFTIFKYSNINSNNIIDFKMNSQIDPYFDIYKAYYSSRYPDREIEFDPIQSTMIVKLIFLEKIYYIHMALIQYIVLDKIFKVDSNNGLNIKEISEKTNISIQNLQETINSLLHIKLIKRSTNVSSIENMIFYINYDFVHENNKISINSLIIPTNQEEKEIKKEFLHDRNIIILSNIYDYIKKNKTFTLDVLYDEMNKKKIPFQINLEQITSAIKVMLEKEDIVEINNDNQNIIYKYSE
jgi:hypothetical protein